MVQEISDNYYGVNRSFHPSWHWIGVSGYLLVVLIFVAIVICLAFWWFRSRNKSR